jgi:hypothetical protein
MGELTNAKKIVWCWTSTEKWWHGVKHLSCMWGLLGARASVLSCERVTLGINNKQTSPPNSYLLATPRYRFDAQTNRM